jgi:hypothetical protein
MIEKKGKPEKVEGYHPRRGIGLVVGVLRKRAVAWNGDDSALSN